MILNPGEKLHVIQRRHFENEAHRHFVGVVEAYEGGIARVIGHVFTVDRTRLVFFKRPEVRTRLISIVSAELLINIIPDAVNLDAIEYKQMGKELRVTDGSSWHLDISEKTWV
ncbi:MAG: hypothetical protein V4727_03575 [Verrucomicrobiota bacterium]